MAIALDSTASVSSNVTGGNSQTWSHTCTGTNLILIVFIVCRGGTPASTFSTPTYNGVSLTAVGSDVVYDSTNSRVNMFYLVNPPTGTHTISTTVANNTGPIEGFSASYTGAKQSGQPDASGNTSSGSSNVTTLSSSLSVVAANSWIVAGAMAVVGGASGNVSGTSGVSSRIANPLSGAWLISGLLDSNGGVSSGSNSIGLSQSGSSAPFAMVYMSIAPVASLPKGNFLSFM